MQVQLYSDETLLTTATLQGVNPGSYDFLTCCIATETADEYWSLTPWTPKDDVVPNKVVLFVDDNEMDTMEFTLDDAEWAALPGTVLPPSGSIERAGITHDNGDLKNAVSVDLKNVNFESSVQVKLYSGDTLLTTATLNTNKLGAGSYPYLTCCIATETADEYWALTPWTPKDNVVPDKAVLVVDGHEQDTKTFTLDADEWAALPGTVLPPSGSIERAGITHANGVLKNAVSVDLKNVNFESSVQVKLYSGDTLLTTATLQGVTPGSYDFLTCCIATETADEYWALTPWTPKDNVVPDKAVLVVDGHEQDTKTFTLDADEWAALPGTVLPPSGSIERAVITHDNGVLKNAVSVDLKNVNFESSVQVQLYSGETLLTTATLNTDKLEAGSYTYLTCCIATETADEYWSLTPWTPKDNVVPNKVVLFVDGNEMDTMEFTLDAEDWAALPGTAFPYSGSIGGGYTYYTIKATAGVNGSISPTGNVSVREGRDQTFTITPNKGYAVDKVLIDSKNVGAVKSYTFENVKKNHTIEVVFMKASGNPQTGVFVDVPEGSYYEEAVNWAVEKGITTGTDATHFSPDGICTRAQAVTFLWRAAGSPAAKSAVMPFADVKVGSYYYDAVLWAVENGITKGTSETMFSPDATCSRAQIVTFLWRSQKSPAAGTANPFTDVKASAYYADAVLWAVKEDVTKGTANTTFSPDADCTRAQIVTFIWRCEK